MDAFDKAFAGINLILMLVYAALTAIGPSNWIGFSLVHLVLVLMSKE